MTNYVYVTNMGALYRFTKKRWREYLIASARDADTDIEHYATMVDSDIRNVTDWDEVEFSLELAYQRALDESAKTRS